MINIDLKTFRAFQNQRNFKIRKILIFAKILTPKIFQKAQFWSKKLLILFIKWQKLFKFEITNEKHNVGFNGLSGSGKGWTDRQQTY